MLFVGDECIEWDGARFAQGYGAISIGGKSCGVHRIIAEGILDTKLTRKDFVCHTCNNKLCFNPRHLYIGNGSTNAKDRIKAGTAKNASHRAEVREKIRQSLLGKKHSEERKRNISKGHLGQVPRNKNTHML